MTRKKSFLKTCLCLGFGFISSNATFPAGDGFLPPERSPRRDSPQTRQERGERQGSFPEGSVFSPAERVFRRAGSPKGIWGKDRACCRASCPSPIRVPGSWAGGFLIFISKCISTSKCISKCIYTSTVLAAVPGSPGTLRLRAGPAGG